MLLWTVDLLTGIFCLTKVLLSVLVILFVCNTGTVLLLDAGASVLNCFVCDVCCQYYVAFE